MTLFAQMVRELDSPHCSKTPTPTFRNVTAALARLSPAPTSEIARSAGKYWAETDLVLLRLRRYGCATLTRGPVRGPHHAKNWRITDLGRALAGDLEAQP